MLGSSAFLVLATVTCVLCERDPRWFNRETRTVTRVVKETQMITEVTPSSCVVVQTSLPACRHLRSVGIQPSQSIRTMQTMAPSITPQNQGWKPLIQPSDPLPPPRPDLGKTATPVPNETSSWGWNFFNFGPKEVYVTQTLREISTTKYMDPNTVVTFSVKGCRPSRLPFDLPECQPPRSKPLMTSPVQESPENGVIVMAPIQFVPSVAQIRTSETIKEEKREDVKEAEKILVEKKNETIALEKQPEKSL